LIEAEDFFKPGGGLIAWAVSKMQPFLSAKPCPEPPVILNIRFISTSN
jgi:hypothetical protein